MIQLLDRHLQIVDGLILQHQVRLVLLDVVGKYGTITVSAPLLSHCLLQSLK